MKPAPHVFEQALGMMARATLAWIHKPKPVTVNVYLGDPNTDTLLLKRRP